MEAHGLGVEFGAVEPPVGVEGDHVAFAGFEGDGDAVADLLMPEADAEERLGGGGGAHGEQETEN